VGLVSIFYQAFWWLTRVIEIVVVVWVVISWVLFFAAQTSFRWRYKTAFSILNQLNEIFTRMTYPFLRPFRKILPPWKTAGIDWSPLLLLLAIFILRGIVGWLYGIIHSRVS
jgi:uncharacterized protein YggT (Ycf19 family)